MSNKKYNPHNKTKLILDRAWSWVQSVEYPVTLRWVFYRLLQDGTYNKKESYSDLVRILAKARKEFFDNWRPWTLKDDTRAPVLLQREGYYGLHLRGNGFDSEEEWLKSIKQEINCPLNRWRSQPVYAEIYFEAAAMQGQFLYYANENLPLLAFHGDVSIAEKWRAAQRLAARYQEFGKPIHIYYFGDYDPKGLTIPESAWRDIWNWTGALIINQGVEPERLHDILNYHRVGINSEQISDMGIPENPEKPGKYQWEALDDNQARQLIEQANEYLELTAFEKIATKERQITEKFRQNIEEA